jgi:RNA polymerase sigma-70 factor (ECF subfamily)
MSDLAFAQRLLAADDTAFEEFFAEYFPKLFRFALARLGTEDAAEEVVQTTLMAAVRKLHTYRGDAAMMTWLCSICRHEISSWLQRAERHVDVPLLEDRADVRAALEAVAAGAPQDPEHAHQRAEVARLVHATLDRLPARYGDVLEWRYIEGVSVEDIARRLALSYKATESLLSRARDAFRAGFAAVGSTL